MKKLPYTPNRTQIYNMYRKQMSICVVKKNLDMLTKEYQLITKKIISIRIIPRDVWVEFLGSFNTPEGYKSEPDWLEEKTIFNR